MSKQVIHYGGENHVVREDTAKSFRGVYWALFSLAAIILIAAILFLGGFFTSPAIQTPADVERQAGR